MTQPWTAEHVVDAALARSLLESQFPDLAPAHVEPLGFGFDNTGYLANGTWVFRFPRRRIAVPLIERELAVLPAIASRVPLPIPVPEHAGHPALGYPWPFSGYRLLPGRTACTAALTAEQRSAIAEPLGHFLRALHAFPQAEATALGAGGDDIGRMDVDLRRRKGLENLADLRTQGLMEEELLRFCEHLLSSTPADLPRPAAVLVHGDLYARHLLVDPDARLAGVIDWGDVHLGDPAVDLAIVHGFLPARAREVFRRAYGAIDDGTWRLARFRAAYHALMVVRFAHGIGDADLLRETQLALRHVRED